MTSSAADDLAWEVDHANLRPRSDDPDAEPEADGEDEVSEEETPWPSGPWFGKGKTSADA